MIRVRTYDNAPRAVHVPGVQSGNALPSVGHAEDAAETRVLSTLLDAGEALTGLAVKRYVADESARLSQSLQKLNADLSAERDRYMQENRGEAAVDAETHFASFAGERAQKYLEEGGFQGAFAEAFERQAAGSVLHFVEQGRKYGNEQHEAWKTSVFEGALSDFQNQVSQNYDNDEWLEYSFNNLEGMVNAMRPGLDNAAVLNDMRKSAASGVIDGYLSHDDIAGASRAVERFSSVLGDRARALSLRVEGHAQALQAKRAAADEKAAREILKGHREAVRQAEYFGDTSQLEDMSARLGVLGKKDEAEALRAEAERYAGTREVSVFASNRPLPEVADLLKTTEKALEEAGRNKNTAEHEKQTKKLKAVASIYHERVKALKEDPAAAVEQSNLFQLPDDATPEDRVNERLAAQERNGVPSPVPLTNEEVEHIAALYQQSESPAAFAGQIADGYGDQRQAVIRQLVTSGKLPPDTALVLNMPASSAELLMQMNRKGAVRETENALGVDTSVRDSVNGTVREELSDILQTFSSQGNTAAPAQILNASYKLTLKYMEQGQSASDAAERAAREVMADRYEVRDGYRIPRTWDADIVSAGADRYRERLAASGDVAMDEVTGLTAPTAATKRAILKNARWVNDPDESGLRLTVNGRPVLTAGGDIVQVSFDELVEQMKEAQGVDALRGPVRT